MGHDRTGLQQDPRYAAFLYSAVGEDQRGASVTVLSMLARLGVDPWREASELARLPTDGARRRLSALMARFVDVPSAVPACSEDVSRLLAGLPHEAGAPGLTVQGSTTITPALLWVVALVVLLALFGGIGRG